MNYFGYEAMGEKTTIELSPIDPGKKNSKGSRFSRGLSMHNDYKDYPPGLKRTFQGCTLTHI